MAAAEQRWQRDDWVVGDGHKLDRNPMRLFARFAKKADLVQNEPNKTLRMFAVAGNRVYYLKVRRPTPRGRRLGSARPPSWTPPPLRLRRCFARVRHHACAVRPAGGVLEQTQDSRPGGRRRLQCWIATAGS